MNLRLGRVNELEKHVTLKGTNEGYYLILNDESSFQEIHQHLDELFEHLKNDNKHNQSFDLTIESGNRLLKDDFKEELIGKLTNHTNFSVKRFVQNVIEKDLAEQWHKETTPLMVVKNIRNGQIVRSDRDIILFGDVRPGGLVRSAGSIMVIGDVKGTIHAGLGGDDEAVIIAPFSYDAQVRIGEHVEIIDTEDEANEVTKHTMPQVVFLNDLHVIEFAGIDKLAQIRPDFAKDLGGFEEWQKRL